MKKIKNCKTGLDVIKVSREHQINNEGFTIEDDIEMYPRNQLSFAAVSYALPYDTLTHQKSGVVIARDDFFPWNIEWFKPSKDQGGNDGRIKELGKAGALIAAEIDRLIALKNNSTEKS